MLRHVKNHVNKLKQPARHVWNWNLRKEIFAPFSSYTFLVPNDLAAGPRCLISTPLSPNHPERPPVFSVLYYVIKVTLHYLMLHRFEIHSALELSRTDCSYLVASRLCEAARWPAIIRFAIVIIILPVCNASQLTYQYATSIDNKTFSDLT